MFADALSRPPHVNCISIEEVKQAQRSDGYLQTLRAKKTCPTNLLFRNLTYYHTDGRLFVPRNKRLDILKACHDNAGHFGLDLTLNSIRQTFYWPNLYSDTENYVLSCNECQASNPARPKTKLPLSTLKPIAITFGDRFHLDLVDMPKSSSGHVAICTIVDAATGFVIVHPCMDKTHRGVIEALRTKVIPYFGCPKLLVTDKGKENVNNEVRTFLRNYHISHICSSTGHPQSNGMVERRQQMIISYFKKLLSSPSKQSLWHEALPEFQTIINSTSSASRKHSPFFLTYFRHSHFPFQQLINRTPSLDETSSVEARLNFSRSVLREAAEHVETYHAMTKTQFDKNTKTRKFPVGSKVFVQTSQRAGMSKKLAPHRSQHLTFNEPDTDLERPETDADLTISNPFRFSAIDCPTPVEDALDDALDDRDRTPPEPVEPPDPNPDTDQHPDPEGSNTPAPGAAARYPADPGLRQSEPPGPPRTRAAARVPGQELPALPGIAHDRLPIERMLHKLKKRVNPSDK